jgi:hypothetical protein
MYPVASKATVPVTYIAESITPDLRVLAGMIVASY